MTDKLKFNDNEFDIVFANLSIHFFNEKDTQNLLNEIHRILKPNGLFTGSVNSTSAYEFIKDYVTEIEKYYYRVMEEMLDYLMNHNLKSILINLIKLY